MILFFFSGLESASPATLKDTMLPNVGPELTAEAAVQVAGGYSPNLFTVGVFCGTNFTQVGINCLYTSGELMNYAQAKRKCQDMGSKVVEFQKGQEFLEVRSESIAALYNLTLLITRSHHG